MWSDPELVAMGRWALEALSAAVLLATCFYVMRHWGELPARVPAHFDFRGRPDRWTGRWVLLLMLGVMAATLVMLSWNGGTLLLLEGRIEVRVRESFIMTWVKLHTLIILGFALWTMIRVARGQAQRFHVWVVALIAGFMILPLYLFDRG